jgi:RHS repeat-associated protein
VTGSGASTLKKNTLFKTTTTAKEQGTSSQSTVLERKYTYNTQGMVTKLGRKVAGTLMNTSAGTTVALSDHYNYDAFGRFDTHAHTIGGSTEYTLDMTYNKAGGIVKKDALATGITNFQDLNYTLNYNYSASNPHQLADVIDSKSGAQSYYQYNSSGSIQEIQDPAAGGPQSFFWNEEQWLSGVSNDLGVHHYVYDYKGERVMKSSVMQSSVQVNDKNIDDIEYLEPYTLYINPYYVVTELQGGDKVSKHYYMNTQRVATDISINYQAQESMAGPQQPNARDPKKPSEDTASVNYNAAFADLQATLNALGHQKLDVNGLGQQPTLEEYYPELVRETAFNSTAAKNAPESTTRVLFWYHPDYLGNVDLVTERDGKTYEFFTYNPWGEEMHQYNANTFSFSSPYRFNAKEKDSETGLHYYGARYYQPKLSMWLSVDPLAHKFPHKSPYAFVENNPINLIDPDGREPIRPLVGSVSTFVALLNNSPRKVGGFTGKAAHNYMMSLGNTEFSWKQMRPLPTQTGYFNQKKGRYIYTKKGGWVDMTHFMFYAGKAYKYKQEGVENPIGEAVQDGYKQEFSDQYAADHSAYSYEDLPSDKYGAEFATEYFDPESDKTFSEQLQDYMNNVLEATSPENAPNYEKLPTEDTGNPPTRTNKTTTPVYTADNP